MSEQTPNSSEDLSGAEPSMEDILASIRKIISDDEPVAMESPEDVTPVSLVESESTDPLDDLMQGIHMDSNDLTSDAVLETTVAPTPVPSPPVESVDLNIDDVLAGLDEDVLGFDLNEPSAGEVVANSAEATASEALEATTTTDVSDSFDIDSLMPTPELIESDGEIPETDDDILAFLDADIPLSAEPAVVLTQPSPEVEPVAIPDEVQEKITSGNDDEMDALLDDILLTPLDIEAEDDFQSESIETGFTVDPSVVEENSDLDLVKSLMADLADDQGEIESDEDLDALLAIPEVEDESELQALEIDVSNTDIETAEVQEPEPEDDILGDILNMTLEDELQNHPDDVVTSHDEHLETLDAVIEAEQENLAENALSGDDDIDDDLPSLSEIAAAAEADAVAAETVTATQAVTATAGLGAIAGLAALSSSVSEETTLDTKPAEAETETAETYFEPSPEPHTNQETSMPVKAVKTDAILDDVTEAATAGAFAELNQVVEDKAIFNERGPRIGDLVQEALRPMLKEWLDANLKGIVERAVAKEVKRISQGK